MPTVMDILADNTTFDQSEQKNSPQHSCLGSGNRCGHDPDSPKLFAPPENHKDRPPILVKWIERVKKFYEDPMSIPSLATVLFKRKTKLDLSIDHTMRQMRSERREACCSLLGAIAHYLDLPSLCLSVPQDDGSLRPIRLDTLAEAAGLSMRRAERAMRDIVEAGLVTAHHRCEEIAEGVYVGRAAIRVVKTTFFALFGLEERLAHDRRRISQQRIKAREGQQGTRTEKARLSVALDALGAGGATVPKPQTANVSKQEPNEHTEGLRQILGAPSKNPVKNPVNYKNPEQVRAEAEAMLRVAEEHPDATDAELSAFLDETRNKAPP